MICGYDTMKLSKLLDSNNLDAGINDLKAIYLAGDQITKDFVLELERVQAANIHIANPFKGQKLFINSKTEMDIPEHPEKFLAGVGLALRRDT